MSFGTHTAILLGLILVLSLLVITSLNIYIGTQKPKVIKRKVADLPFINTLKSALGESNLSGVTSEHERIKFSVKEISKANLEVLKTLSTKGIFVNGKNITMTFDVDPSTIIEAFKGDF